MPEISKPVVVDGIVIERIRAAQPYRSSDGGYLRTQREFAAKLGVTERTLRRWESDAARFSAKSLALKALRALAAEVKIELQPSLNLIRKEKAERKKQIKKSPWLSRRIRRHG